jgi:hypothetical protein
MKTLIIIAFTCLSILFSTISAKASVLIYLPMVANSGGVRVIQAATTSDFTVDSMRLWEITENGGAQTTPLQCGEKHKLQVHVFDVNGDHGEQSRLTGVIVHVIQFDKQGNRTEEEHATGLPGMDPGVGEFELKQQAQVSLRYDVNGHSVTSAIAVVSNVPAEIPLAQLIASGYCTDNASCQTFINANRCSGAFSWNIVFKRNF